MKFKLVPQRIVQLMSLVVTQVTTEHEDCNLSLKILKIEYISLYSIDKM